MSKSVWFAAAAVASVFGVSACSVPTPRYAIVPDPLAAQAPAGPEAAPAAPPLAEPAAPAPAERAPEPVAETPRAAPLGRIETVALAELPPVTEPASPAATQVGAQVAPPPAPVGQPAPVPADATLSHVVGPGDTFFAIARRYGVGPQAVAELNGMTFDSTLRLGQRIQLPAGARDRGADAARAGGVTLAQSAPVVPAAQESVQTAPVQTAPARATVVEPEAPAVVSPAPVVAPAPQPIPAPAPARSAPPIAAPVVAAPPPLVAPAPAPSVAATAAMSPSSDGRGLFVWPLRGDLISGFGPKGVGQRSDGVNITAAEGDPVRASAAGTVVYAGDQVKGGFGKLVLVEHENRWFTAYAHLSDIRVRMKERVTQNQTIGLAGRTGSVGAPQLYFEVRHAPTPGERARPVDPIPLLPQ